MRNILVNRHATIIGTSWGRTLGQITRHIAGLSAPCAKFVNLMGSLTASSAFNPFEVVQAFASTTGTEGHFLPVPFIADNAGHRDILMSQRTVKDVLHMARNPDTAFISVGELTETSLLRQSGMISLAELRELHQAGAVGGTNGIFFGTDGSPVDHELNQRTLAVGLDDLAKTHVVLLSAGTEKRQTTCALLRGGIVNTLIINGDTAKALVRTFG